MFCPLNGSGVSPRRRSTRHSAAVINDLPAPLLVPSTISGVGAAVTTGGDGAVANGAPG